MKKYLNNYFTEIYEACNSINQDFFSDVLMEIKNVKKNDAKIILAGNGGSAAISSHVAVDFTKAAGVRAVNFNEADLITCFANDFGYEEWLSKAIEYYALQKDLIILISSSGKSANMVSAAKKCRQMELKTVTLTGFDDTNPLRQLGQYNAWVNSQSYNTIEMTHHIWLLALVDKIIDMAIVE